MKSYSENIRIVKIDGTKDWIYGAQTDVIEIMCLGQLYFEATQDLDTSYKIQMMAMQA